MTTLTHVMIDLETMGTLYNAPILAIGAVWFDPTTGELGKKFYGAIDIEDACRHGRPSGGTIKWWMEQDDEARKAAVAGKLASSEVFAKFREFLLKPEVAMQPWGNGACFDISMLEYAFLKVSGSAAPWKFWNVRDCRTIRELGLAAGKKFKGERGGTHHQALDDAIYQAQEVSHYWQTLVGGAKAASDVEDLLA